MKDRSLGICRYIREILQEDEGVTSLISKDKINTLINNREDEIRLPIITITRNSIEVNYTKDIYHYNTVRFTVNIYGRTYDEAVDLAIEVRHALETYRWINSEIHMDPIELEGAYESYDDMMYVETLDFSCIMK